MTRKAQTRSLAPIRGVATLAAETIDRDARTVELTFYSGARVFRFPMFDDPYELEFEVSPEAAKLSRLNAGAPLMDSHLTHAGVGAMFGVVEKAWIADGEGRARVRFSKRADVEPIWQDVLDGVIRNVSMGTYILAMEDVTPKGADVRRMRATEWEPYELSLVPVPADPGAQVMEAADAETRPCVILSAEAAADAPQKESVMTKIKVRLLADTDIGKLGEVVEILESDYDAKLHSKELAPPVEPETMGRKIDAVIAADKERKAHIQRLASHFGLDDLWVQRQINLGATPDQAAASATEERSKRSPTMPNAIGFGTDFEAWDHKLAAMSDAVVARSTNKAPAEMAAPYRNMSFADLALQCLSRHGKGRGLDPRRDAARIFSSELALHTTSDFPLLLANALNKMLLPAYGLAAPTYRTIAAQKPFNDFRPHLMAKAGDFPNLLQTNEHGEFQYGTMSEGTETVTAATFGRIIGFSRQMLINDDLSAFADMPAKAARRLADFENALFYTNCIKAGSGLGPTLAEGSVAVYHATHANITGAGALSNTLLESAFALMLAQTSLDGLKLNVMPRYLLVSPTSYGLARRLLVETQATQATEINTFAGMISPITDANLTGTRFYVLADPGVLPNYVYGYVAGGGPRFEVRNGFESDGVEWKLALDFGVGAIDFRGGVTGAGA